MRRVLLLVLLTLSAGCIGAGTDGEGVQPQADVTTNEADLKPLEMRFEGRGTGTPVTPDATSFEMDVPQGAVGLNGTLAWNAPVARFRLTLIDPYGEVVATGYPEQTGILRVATVEPPASGKWLFKVETTAGVDVPYTLDAIAELLVPTDNIVRATAQMRAATFREINVIMEENATFNFTFEASDVITWDVHSHPPEGIKYWQEGADKSMTGSFTAPARGIYSLLFENANALPVDITYEMTGAFRLHSHAQ